MRFLRGLSGGLGHGPHHGGGGWGGWWGPSPYPWWGGYGYPALYQVPDTTAQQQATQALQTAQQAITVAEAAAVPWWKREAFAGLPWWAVILGGAGVLYVFRGRRANRRRRNASRLSVGWSPIGHGWWVFETGEIDSEHPRAIHVQVPSGAGTRLQRVLPLRGPFHTKRAAVAAKRTAR